MAGTGLAARSTARLPSKGIVDPSKLFRPCEKALKVLDEKGLLLLH